MKHCVLKIVMAVVFICSGYTTANASELYFPPPKGRWETVSPEEAGMDPKKLQAVVQYAGGQRTSGLIVLYKGRLVSEHNWDVKTNKADGKGYALTVERTSDGRAVEDVASIQKSVISFIAAIARDRGKLDISRPVSSYLGNGWANASLEQEKKITIRHLLTMTSGLNTKLEYENPAGSVWKYNTQVYSKMIPVLEAATGEEISGLTENWLSKPAEMTESRWIKRPWADGSTDENRLGFASTARDLAKFGLLILANGSWNGQALIKDTAFLTESLAPSQYLNPNYGFLWWLNTNGRDPALPKDTVRALGFLDRIVMIIPGRQFVFVRIGNQGEKGFKAKLSSLLKEALPR